MVFAMSCNEQIIDPETLSQPSDVNLKAGTIGTTYYVAKSGSDNNAGSITSPFLTIQKAANIVNPGDVVIVDDGNYTTTGGAVVSLTRSGTAASPITFKSKNKWGAKFDGRSNATDNAFEFNKVSYVNLRDFEFKGFAFWTIVVNVGSSHIEITGNNIHDIGRLCTDTTYGLVGCYLNEATDIVFSHNILHDIGRFSTGEGGCTNASNNFKNHDHGLYLNGVTNVTASYNVFYNIHNGQGMHIYSYNNSSSSNINVLNNTFAYGNSFYAAGHIMIWCSLTNSTLANNIFYSQVGSGLQIYQGSFVYSNVQIKNNITYLGTGNINEGTATGVTLTNNMNATDPKMVNPAGFDFRLQATSPGINTGINVGLTSDYSSMALVGLPDIGANEYGSTTSATPPVVTPPVVTPPVVTPPVVTPPVVVTYYSTATSGTATKNSCGTGYSGSVVTYSVSGSKYSSTTSQADANNKAIADVSANKQAYANANGTCTRTRWRRW